ncbi:MAG: multicopper oxidase domain-containing protein [Ilumatobacter sp.]|nr:multicopper oxidase domain-containing protein [Ilumatobacter sp.]
MTTVETPPSAGPGDGPPDTYPRLDRSASSMEGTGVFLLAAAVIVVMIAGIVVIGLVALLRDNSTAASTATTNLEVSLTEFAIDGQLTAPEGNVVLNVFNDGAIEHNLAIRGTDIRSKNLLSRGLDIVNIPNLSAGTYELYCTIAGHEGSGMTAELVITAGGEAAPAAAAEGHEMTAAEMDQVMIDSMLAFPTATEGSGNQLLDFEVLADGTKQFELTAAITPWEVSPGQIVEAWSYNGMVPAPQIKVDVGDKVQVIVHNETPMGTDVHWHGIHTPNDQDGVSPYTQDPISAGETFTYEFVAEDPGIGMYHAHLHSQISVPNGMFGAFIIGENPLPRGQTISGVTIPEDLEVATELPMVLNDAGVIGLSLNGKSFPATEPLVMEEGSWAAVHYYNEGLTSHPMHLHQFPALVYAKDGFPLDQPYYADTINVAPGERYSILFQAEDPGTWVWHCHILTHVERDDGMFGMVTAVVVTPKET